MRAIPLHTNSKISRLEIRFMACALSASNTKLLFKNYLKLEQPNYKRRHGFKIRASSDESDCNVEECAADKEVGKVSVEWLAGDKTKVVGTFPPRKRGWTGYVEKDTAGQNNIYSVEPAVYLAESAISSGAAGSSSDGSGNTVTVVAGIALVFVAAASSILLLVGNNQPAMQTPDYSGPSLSYYINKFQLQGTIKESVSTVTEASMIETSAPEILQPVVESGQET